MGFFLERRQSGNHFVEHRPEGKLVGTKIDFVAGGLLRRHIADSAHDGSVLGDGWSRRPNPRVAGRTQFRQTEIQNLGRYHRQ